MGTAVLEESAVRQDNSGLVEAIRRSNREIERRGRLLLSNGNNLSGLELMKYCALAMDMGYRKMENVGNEILNQGGTFPAMRITTLLRYGNGYALRAVEEETGIEFTLLCGASLKQYIGDPINLGVPKALQSYAGKDVTIDVSRTGSDYKAIMIGLAKDVLGDSTQATRLDLIR